MALFSLTLALLFTVYCLFAWGMKRKVGHYWMLDLRIVFASIFMIYTVYPMLAFLVHYPHQPEDGLFFESSKPSYDTVAAHGLRHLVFLTSFLALSFILTPSAIRLNKSIAFYRNLAVGYGALLSFTLVILFIYFLLFYYSSEVVDYHGHYGRYNHLGVYESYIVKFSLLAKEIVYSAFLFCLFIRIRSFIFLALIVSLLCGLEYLYSHGSRIYILSILIQSLFLYIVLQRAIQFKVAIFVLGFAFFGFSMTEVLRMGQFSLSELDLFDRLFGNVELTSVFYTGYHAYHEASQGNLPQAPALMYFNDFLRALPFLDKTQYNTQYWFAQLFWPDSEVPPQTMGPIADSAIFLGSLSIIVSSLASAFLLSFVFHTMIRFPSLLAIYIYLYFAGHIFFGIKYSVVYILSESIRSLIFIAVFYFFYQNIRFLFRTRKVL